MTWVCAGMTVVCAGMTVVCAGMTVVCGNDGGGVCPIRCDLGAIRADKSNGTEASALGLTSR